VRNLHRAPSLAQLDHSPLEREPPLSAAERRRVALAALQIQEQRHRLQLARIAAERRALLAAPGSNPYL
jgi:hypothetical protein